MDGEIPDILHGGDTPESKMEGLRLDDSRFCFLLMLGVILIITGHGIEDAEGAGTPIWEPEMGMIDEDPTTGEESDNAARGSNNIIYRAWQDDDWSIKVSYTSNNGSSWATSTVINSAWKTHTAASVGGIVVLANNTVIVHFYAADADDDFDWYVACRWEWAGAWDIIKIWGGASVGGLPKMTVNETCVLLTYAYNLQVRYKHFFPSNSDVEPDSHLSATAWYVSDNQAHNYDVTVNQSGYFIITAATWSGSNIRFYTRDLNGTHAAIYAVEGSGLVIPTGCNLVCTSDDLLTIGAMGFSLGNSWIFHWYETVRWGGFSQRNINHNAMTIQGLGSCIDDNDWLTYYWVNDTSNDPYISKMMAFAIDATVEEWETRIVDAVYDYGTTDDVWYDLGWYNGKYPVVGGYSVNIPNVGWMGQHIWEDEQGDPDDYAFGLYWNATFYWYEYNLPPEFSDESPTNTTTGVVLQPWCHVTIEDPEGDAFNVTWYENSTGSWIQRQQNLTASNGTFWWRFTQASSYGTTYYWKLVANDTNSNENTTIYHFTTLDNTPPVGSSPFPSNGSSGITPTPTCRITVSDANGDPMDISWLENTTGSWVERHADSGVSNGEFSFQFIQFSAYSTTYYWRINLTDGTDNVTYIFHFTTMDNLAPTISFPSPGNGSTSSPSPTTSITVGDIDSMDVDWLEWTGGSWVLRQRSTGISSGVYNWVFSGATEDDETYYWAVNATDGSLNTTEVYHFTVETVAPTEEDEGWNLEALDYGMFIGLGFLIIVVMIAGLGAIIKYTRDDA